MTTTSGGDDNGARTRSDQGFTKRVSDIDRNLPATLHDIRSVTARQAPNMSKTLAKNIAPL